MQNGLRWIQLSSRRLMAEEVWIFGIWTTKPKYFSLDLHQLKRDVAFCCRYRFLKYRLKVRILRAGSCGRPRDNNYLLEIVLADSMYLMWKRWVVVLFPSYLAQTYLYWRTHIHESSNPAGDTCFRTVDKMPNGAWFSKTMHITHVDLCFIRTVLENHATNGCRPCTSPIFVATKMHTAIDLWPVKRARLRWWFVDSWRRVRWLWTDWLRWSYDERVRTMLEFSEG